jgi:hypothetical protein
MVLRSRTWIVPFLSIVPVHVGFESDAHAECDPEFRDFCAIRVDEGEPAPFSGQLLSDELAIALIQKAEDCDKECELPRCAHESCSSPADRRIATAKRDNLRIERWECEQGHQTRLCFQEGRQIWVEEATQSSEISARTTTAQDRFSGVNLVEKSTAGLRSNR